MTIPVFRKLTELEVAEDHAHAMNYDFDRERELEAWREENWNDYRPTCKVEDHKWQIEISAGCLNLICLDPHTEKQIMQMDYATYPGCQGWESEYLAGMINVELEWHSESSGYYETEWDSWLEITAAELDT